MKEKTLVRYLLGELSEEEQVRLEQRAFTDARLTQEIVAAECDLIDEYVRGELSGAKRRRFESRFFAAAERREKVEFARALSEVVAAIPGPVPRAELRWWQSGPTWLGGLPAGLGLATAAGLLLLVGVSWLASERFRLRAQLADLNADLATLQRQEETLREEAAAARAHSEELAGQLAQERQRLAQLVREEVVGDRARRGSTVASALAVLFLPPGVGRGDAGLPQLVLPEATEFQVQLLVGLEPEDDYESFLVELRTVAGQEVWTQQELHARQSSAGPVVDLTLPGSALGAGEHELQLTGVSGEQSTEDVRYYYFLVPRQ